MDAFTAKTAGIHGKIWERSMHTADICKKYPGECTVTEGFCAKRHKLAVSCKPSSFNMLGTDSAIECSLCATCKIGIVAYSNLSDTIDVKQKPSKARLGGLNSKKAKRLRKGESPYSRSYIGGKHAVSI